MKMSPKKVPVTLRYASSGTQPPVFIAGSFSENIWHPQEMDYATSDHGEHEFKKEVIVDEGSQHQYKFRIGLGDWWAVNEQAPTVTDELGNRNNLLVAPTHVPEESSSESSHSDFIPTPPDSQPSIPDVVVEKVDDEPRHGDDFGENSTAAQKVAHEKRAADAEPDHVIIRSEASTPIYASTAAEVADSAAILDREASPAPISDEEAGRTGERRLSSTPIPQVASTIAEVADSAAIIDKDAMKITLPTYEYNPESFSVQATPGHERAPLFAHECLSPSREDENRIGDDGTEPEEGHGQQDPLPNPPRNPEEVSINDPTLEEFPKDRHAILAHMISTETRLSEDETHFEGVPPSPIASAKSRSTSIDTPSYMRLDAQPSPLLDIIVEENQDAGVSSLKLPSPSQSPDLLRDAKEVPENEDKSDLNVKSNSVDPIVVDHPIRPLGPEKSEAAKDFELPTDTRSSSLAQKSKGIEEESYLTETENLVDRAEAKNSDHLTIGHARDGELPLHVERASIPAEDTPFLVENTVAPVEKEFQTADKLQTSSDTWVREQIADGNESEAAVSPEVSTDVEQQGQKSESAGKAIARSPDIIGLSAAFGGSAVGGAIVGGLLKKDLSHDTAAHTEDAHEASTRQTDLQDLIKSDADNQISREVNDEPELSLPTIGISADTAVNELALDVVTPQIPAQVIAAHRKEAAEPDTLLSKSPDTAKSTSHEDPFINSGNSSSLKIRKVTSEDRASTPTSVRSVVKNSKSRSFFLSIWRTVFVGWIGGFLARLWGLGSGSPLTLLALLLVIFVPVLYFSQIA